MKSKCALLTLLLSVCLTASSLFAQELQQPVLDQIGELLTETARKEISVGKVVVDSTWVGSKELALFTNLNFSYIPFREDNVAAIYESVRELLPAELQNYELTIQTDGRPIEELIPVALRGKRSKKIEKIDKNAAPLITRLSVPYRLKNGLNDRHIAMWQSHGYYYEQKLSRWEWQRARIFQTVEDLYTQSYVLPFLVPMLENAGATVLLPRERDTQTTEIIVDNDGSLSAESRYTERNGAQSWNDGEQAGFAQLKDQYIDFENPFTDGTYRQATTVKKGNPSVAEWVPKIPKKGKYAVYVSYKSLPNSTEDARYTVFHDGGESQFKINQRMGGGTWIYLGHFGFGNGSAKIALSNLSDKAGRIVTADAVKIGGGMGNIARTVSREGTTENVRSSDALTTSEADNPIDAVEYPYEVSGYPRFTEASRYWMQWAGVPDSIYSASHGRNDYTDDYKSRGLWVNYLAGGSKANPDEEGLNIPIDLSFAFHSDAGTTLNDSIIGTLGIYYTHSYDGELADGSSRNTARDLTDLVQSSIVSDIQALYEPDWTRRGMWNKSYFEASAPRVPAMLLELLSHQNFADMRYGLDPRFRFTVSRAIYKGMLRYMSTRFGMEYIVQPLPVDQMSLRLVGDNEVQLNWQPVDDPLELTAKADQYVVYTRIGNGDFDNGVVVNKNSYSASIPTGMVCSFKVAALNKGGLSFPSEILSVGKAFGDKGTVLVINGFNRISAPADFVAEADSLAGFLDPLDHGVPYLQDISYIGPMKEFRRSIPWMDDDASGFGDSYGTHETMVIAGNSFDYPALHGDAILRAGYSFVSSSVKGLSFNENGKIDMNDYRFVDLILGKQYQTKTGRGDVTPLAFKTFPEELQKAVEGYVQQGGNIFMSGAFVGSDLWDNHLVKADDADKAFTTDVLKYKWRVGQAALKGEVKQVASPLSKGSLRLTYYNELNPEGYVVEAPDAIEPAAEGAYTTFRYTENNLSAGIAYDGTYKTYVLGFPFESIRSADGRERLMREVLDFFSAPRATTAAQPGNN